MQILSKFALSFTNFLVHISRKNALFVWILSTISSKKVAPNSNLSQYFGDTFFSCSLLRIICLYLILQSKIHIQRSNCPSLAFVGSSPQGGFFEGGTWGLCVADVCHLYDVVSEHFSMDSSIINSFLSRALTVNLQISQ